MRKGFGYPAGVLGLGALLFGGAACLTEQQARLTEDKSNFERQFKELAVQRASIDGLIALNEAHFHEAVVQFTRIIESGTKPEQIADGLVRRGRVYARLGNHARTLEDFRESSRLAPLDPSSALLRGETYLEIGEFDHAMKELTVAVTLSPALGRGYALRGDAYLGLYQLDKALDEYNYALKVSPKTATTFARRAALYGAMEQPSKAFADFEAALQIEGDHPFIYSTRGLVNASKGDYRLAASDFATALLIHSVYQPAYKGRGAVRFAVGEFQGATADLVRAVELWPADETAALWCYLARVRAGQEGKSELENNKLRFRKGSVFYVLADVLLGNAKPNEIHDLFRGQNLASEKVQSAKAQFYLGYHALLSGKAREAVKFFTDTIELRIINSLEFIGAREELKKLSR